jgi:hypothetical protein
MKREYKKEKKKDTIKRKQKKKSNNFKRHTKNINVVLQGPRERGGGVCR